jgi:quercetin dioxygenase-like cupin family protein
MGSGLGKRSSNSCTDAMWSKAVEKADEPPASIFCTPTFDPEKPTKDMNLAKMWVAKHEGKQFMKISLQSGFDWRKEAAPMLPKNADGSCPEWCPATHFGYLESGEMGVEFKDGSKQVIKAGQSYLVPPGHRPVLEKDAVMVEFSQDPTWVKAVGAPNDEHPATAPIEPPPESFFCQPCEPDLGPPSKDLEKAKMWVAKHEGKQFMRLSIQAGFDWRKEAAPMLPKNADGSCPEWCPATHFGYLESGEMGVEFKDGSKQVIKAGQSYLVGPGHRPVMEKDAVMVEFSQDPTWSKAVEASK